MKTKAAAKKRYDGFSEAEKSAMRERVSEMKGEGDGEATVLAKIADMPQPDRALGERIHAIIKANAPGLAPRLWYGMPAYTRDGKIVCDFKPASKFKSRYATLEFQDAARLDDGNVWAVGYAIGKLTAADETKIAALIKKAAG